MNGYERRKQQKSDQILRAAIELFRKQGIKKTTVQEIATAAGVSQVTVYNHFGDKYSLATESVRRNTADAIEQIRKIMHEDTPWKHRLEAIIMRKHKVFREFASEYIESLYRDMPELVEEIRTQQLEAREEITYTFLDEGRRLGFVPVDVSNQAVAIYIECIIRGFDSTPDLVSRLTSNPGLFDEFYDVMIYGMVRSEKDADD